MVPLAVPTRASPQLFGPQMTATEHLIDWAPSQGDPNVCGGIKSAAVTDFDQVTGPTTTAFATVILPSGSKLVVRSTLRSSIGEVPGWTGFGGTALSTTRARWVKVALRQGSMG